MKSILKFFNYMDISYCSQSVRVGCCCHLPFETYGRKGGDSNIQLFVELRLPPQAAGVIGTHNCLVFKYNSSIPSTTISFLDIKDDIFFLQGLLCVSVYISIILASTLCMYVMH